MVTKAPLPDPRGVIPEHVLMHVPGVGAGEAPRSVTPLAGRNRNHTFLVRTARGRFAVRLDATAALRCGVDRVRELELHRLAAAAQLAPRVVYADVEQSVLITEFIDGREWPAEAFGRVRDLRALGGRLAQLHSLLPPRAATFDPRAVLEEYGRGAVAAGAIASAAVGGLLTRAAESLERARSHERAPTIIHNDLHHSNVIVADRVYLIDWEYAAVGDPALDLACILAYYPRATAHVVELLEVTGLKTLGVTPMMAAELAWVFELMAHLWEALPGNVDPSDAAVASAHSRQRRRLLAKR